MRAAIALIVTSGALIGCGGRTSIDDGGASASPTQETLNGLHLTSSDEVSVEDLALGDDGRLVLGGFYRGHVDFGGTGASLPDTTSQDGFVVVLDASERVLWAEPLPGLGAQGITGVAISNDGDVVAQGSSNMRDADADAQHPSGTATFLRFDRQGSLNVRKGFAGDRTTPTKLATDSQDAAILLGNFSGQLDFYGPQAVAPPYLLKLDREGNLLWVVHVPIDGDAANVDRLSLAVAPDDSIFVSGSRLDGIVSDGLGFLAKLDSSGATEWTRLFAGRSADLARLNDVAVDSHGNAIVGGSYSGTFSVQGSSLPEIPTVPVSAWVAKLSPSGDVTWAKAFSGQGSGRRPGASVWAIATGVQDQIWLAGTAGTVNVDGELLQPHAASDEVAFVVKLSEDGRTLAARFGDAQQAGFTALAAGEQAYAAGAFRSGLELSGQRQVPRGALDAFLLSLGP